MRKTKKIGGSNVLVTVLLFLGCLTILFPLYMTIIIAFKNPSEMTNDVAVHWHSRVAGNWTTSKKPWKLQTSGTPLETAC